METTLDIPWQNTVDSFASVGKHLMDGNFTDVTFKVGKDGQTKETRAHRAILAARSSVFATMFFGSLPEKEACIEITDITPGNFQLMLRFLYGDETSGINKDNVIDMHSIAHKYSITPLEKFCAQHVKDCVSMENIGISGSGTVVQTLPPSSVTNDLYEDEIMAGHLASFVAANAWKLFTNEEFYMKLSHKHLMYIWEQDAYGTEEGPKKLPEINIFKGAITWATAECERQGLSPDDPMNQRQVLGNINALDFVCFPRMTLKEFHEIATKDGIFTWEEFSQITLYMANTEDSVLPLGNPAVAQAWNTEWARRLDGRLVQIQRGLSQCASAKERSSLSGTCGCDCSGYSKKQCWMAAAVSTCACDCKSNPPKQCPRALRMAGKRPNGSTQMAWISGEVYKVGDVVECSGNVYRALVDHYANRTMAPVDTSGLWIRI